MTNRRHSLNKKMGSGLLFNFFESKKILEQKPDIDWFEVSTEELIGFEANGFQFRNISTMKRLASQYPITLHGVELSIGSVDPIDPIYLRQLKELIQLFKPSCVSDHLCWTGAMGIKTHELLPLPYTEEAVSHVVEKINRVQDFLGVQIALENPPNYITYKHSEMSEWEFMSEIANRSDSGILLDVSNLYVSSKNNNISTHQFLKGLPAQRIAQIHLAGFEKVKGFLLDTHSQPVSDEVWNLYQQVIAAFGPVSTNIEWDTKVPSFEVLCVEVNKAKEIQKKIDKNIAS